MPATSNPAQRYPSPHAYHTGMVASQPSSQAHTRRTLSNATSSTTSSSPSSTNNLARAPTNPSYASSIRRSTSSRSTSSTSYVALMRKQKATVWCDRAQHEDPRLLAAQRAAKTRAAMEVVGGSAAARTSTSSGGGITGGVRSKIRHHGAVKASAYTGGPNLGGAGVPMRLSASEVDEGDSDDERGYDNGKYHQRSGSGRSSLGSAHRGVSFININTNTGGPGTYAPPSAGLQATHPSLTSAGRGGSSGSTPPSAASYSPQDPSTLAGPGAGEHRNSTATTTTTTSSSDDPGETPVPDTYNTQHLQNDYFDHPGGGSGQGNSGGSGSSNEERAFGSAPGLPRRRGEELTVKRKTSEELRRRGSVDDRTMTMSGVRLFVANPDLSD